MIRLFTVLRQEDCFASAKFLLRQCQYVLHKRQSRTVLVLFDCSAKFHSCKLIFSGKTSFTAHPGATDQFATEHLFGHATTFDVTRMAISSSKLSNNCDNCPVAAINVVLATLLQCRATTIMGMTGQVSTQMGSSGCTKITYWADVWGE